MNVSIYQIICERDSKRAAFSELSELKKAYGSLNEAPYEKVFSGNLPASSPEEVFVVLNAGTVPWFPARSLSVSDIVEFEGRFWYTEPIGFSDVTGEFNEESAKNELIRILYFEKAGKGPEVLWVRKELKAQQQLVLGFIEAPVIYSDNAALICNDEGKINGMKPNRQMMLDDGPYDDVIFGPMFITGTDDEGDCVSLTEEQIEKYKKMYT